MTAVSRFRFGRRFGQPVWQMQEDYSAQYLDSEDLEVIERIRTRGVGDSTEGLAGLPSRHWGVSVKTMFDAEEWCRNADRRNSAFFHDGMKDFWEQRREVFKEQRALYEQGAGRWDDEARRNRAVRAEERRIEREEMEREWQQKREEGHKRYARQVARQVERERIAEEQWSAEEKRRAQQLEYIRDRLVEWMRPGTRWTVQAILDEMKLNHIECSVDEAISACQQLMQQGKLAQVA